MRAKAAGGAAGPPAGTRSALRPPSTTGTLIRRAGRIALWLVVAILLLRGFADVMASDQPTAVPLARSDAQESFPDAGAEAYAAAFTRAWLEFDPRHPEFHAAALEPYLGPDVEESAGLDIPERGATQTVREVTIAGEQAIDDQRALVTVLATVATETVTTRYVSVPVGRSDDGRGYVVYDLPSFSPPPATAAIEAQETEELEERDQAEVEDTLARFFAAYLAGESDDLRPFIPPGVRLEAVGQRYELLELVSAAALEGRAEGDEHEVLATLRARDVETGAEYVLRYRVSIERRDRYLVTALNTT